MSKKRKRKGLTVRVTHVANGALDNHTYRCTSVSSQLLERGDGAFGANLRFKGGKTRWASYAQVEYIVAEIGQK